MSDRRRGRGKRERERHAHRERRERRKEKNETIGFAAWFFVRTAVYEKKNVTKR